MTRYDVTTRDGRAALVRDGITRWKATIREQRAVDPALPWPSTTEWFVWCRNHGAELLRSVEIADARADYDEARVGVAEDVCREPDQKPEADFACAWSDYRKEHGNRPGPRDYISFRAGWEAARGTLDIGGAQR